MVWIYLHFIKSMKQKTTDDNSYYKRTKSNKNAFIFDYVKNNESIQKVFDVGCNTALMSYPLQTELGKDVYGIDASDNVTVPKDYKFDIIDITKYYKIYFNDITLFLSLYHHLLGAHGIEIADDVFYKLLLSTNYLIFDVGNVSEISRSHHVWYKEQIKYFNQKVNY